MRKFTLIWVVLMLSQFFATAQNQEFLVFHKNGVFTPKKGNILKDQSQSSYLLFDEKYYVMIQFEQIPGQQIKEYLLSKGIELSGYIPNHTYFASVPSKAKKLDLKALNIRSVFACHKDLKIDKRLKDPEHLANWAMQDDLIQVKIKLTNGVNLAKVKVQLERINGEVKINTNQHSTWLNMKVSKMTLLALSNEPYIEWIEPIHPPLVTDNLPGKTMHGSSFIGHINNKNLTGKNIKVGEWDGGYVGKHIDFDARKTTLDSLVYSDHATHVAGTITSAGIINPYATGMAPEAELFSSDFYNDIQAEMDSAYVRHHIHITSNSYGYSPASDPCPMGNYDGESQRIDELVYKYNDLVHVFAAANSQTRCSGGYRTISSGFNSSKNVITVGAVNYKGEMSNFSSWGPTVDGRLKPEICGVGVNVYSTLDGNNYIGGYNGTSMATPGVSGTVAQLYQLYQNKYSTNPDASIIRAIVCNTATDKGNAHADYKYGFGIINAIKAAEMIDSSRFQTDTISDGNTHTYTYDIPSGVNEFRLTLAWTDKEASSSSNVLVNNLDAYIITPSNDTIRPWILNPSNPGSIAVRGIDTVNNIEQLTIDSPTAGTYTLYVNGTAVPYGPQFYTITAYSQVPELLLTYPNGNEKLTPGTVETIRWNSFATSQGFSLDYSLDSGATWTNISNSINANHFDWSVPNVSSSNVLIKVYNSNYMDSSDGVFTIFSPTTNLSAIACSSAVNISWNSVSSANSYHIYRLNQANKAWDLLDSTNSSTTSYTDVNVVNGNQYYYTVTSVGQNGMESNRAYAISAKPEAMANGLVTISGSTTLLCGDQISLSAKAANSYLWNNGATTQSIQVSTAGTYQVELVYNASCTAKSGLLNIRDGFSASIDEDTLCEGNTTLLHAQSDQLNTLRITEIVQNKTAYGSPSSYPSWITGSHANADYVELSNMGDDTMSIGGMTFELWDGSGVLRSYTWPNWAQLLPGETSVLHIGNTATDDSTHMFFNTGGADDASSSGDARGYLLKDLQNKIIDAVAVNNYLFSATSGVSEFDFIAKDPAPFMQGYAGVRLQTADYNRGKEWTLSSPSNKIDLSTYNSGIKTIENATIIWTDSLSFYAEGATVATDTFHSNTKIYSILKSANCTQYKTIDLVIKPLAVAGSIALSSDSICLGDSVQLQLNNHIGAISWQSFDGNAWVDLGLYNQSVMLSPTVDTWYRAISSTECSSIASDSVYVHIKSLPSHGSISISRDSICSNDTITFTWNGSGSAVQNWSFEGVSLNQSASTFQYQMVSSGYMKAEISLNNGCGSVYDSIGIYVYANPYIGTLTSSANAICFDDSLMLNLDSAENGTIEYEYLDQITQTYTMFGSNNASKSIYTSGFDTLTWGGTSFRAKVTSATCGTVYSNIVQVTINEYNQLGSLTSSSDSICRNSQVTLNYTPLGNQVWFNQHPSDWLYQDTLGNWVSLNDTNTSITPTLALNTTYRAAFYQTCDTDYIDHTIYMLPQAIAGQISSSLDTLCLGDSIQLISTNHTGNITWQELINGVFVDMSSNTTPTIYPTSSATYRAKYELGTCDSAFSNQLSVYVSPLPSGGTSAANQANYCAGDSALLTLTNYIGNIQWQSYDSINSTWTNLNVYADTLIIKGLQNSAIYRAEVSNGKCGVAYSSSTIVLVNPLPSVGTIIASKDSVCAGTNVTLTLSSYTGTLTWQVYDSTNANWVNLVSADTLIVNAQQTHNYRVTSILGSCGPVASNAYTIHVKPSPQHGNAVASASSTCVGSAVQITLNGNVAGKIDWQEYNSGNAIWVSKSSGANPYTAFPYDSLRMRAVVSLNGCTSTSNEVVVTTKPTPLSNVSVSGPTTICSNEQVTFTAASGSGNQYQWQKDSVNMAGQTGKTLTTSTAGLYRVVITNTSGCSVTSKNIAVIVYAAPAIPVITRTAGTLDAGIAGLNYQWYDGGVPISGATNQTLNITKAGSYTVKVTNSNGCTNLSAPYINTAISKVTSNQAVIEIYPNPSNGIVTLEYKMDANAAIHFDIVNVNGQLVLSTVRGSTNTLNQIDISHLASGVYILRLTVGSEVNHIKLIKE